MPRCTSCDLSRRPQPSHRRIHHRTQTNVSISQNDTSTTQYEKMHHNYMGSAVSLVNRTLPDLDELSRRMKTRSFLTSLTVSDESLQKQTQKQQIPDEQQPTDLRQSISRLRRALEKDIAVDRGVQVGIDLDDRQKSVVKQDIKTDGKQPIKQFDQEKDEKVGQQNGYLTSESNAIESSLARILGQTAQQEEVPVHEPKLLRSSRYYQNPSESKTLNYTFKQYEPQTSYVESRGVRVSAAKLPVGEWDEYFV